MPWIGSTVVGNSWYVLAIHYTAGNLLYKHLYMQGNSP